MDYVATEVDGRVAVVTISNPPMNPLSAPLLEELTAEVERLDADDDVGAIVLRGGGDRAFVAGADIKEFPRLREVIAESRDGTPVAARHVGPAARVRAQALDRRDPGLLPRRRPRAGDGLRRARLLGRRASSASRRSSSG